ncbi:MAG TPA: anti-sigma regulatory factor [Steroidobacteraceae bacterium]|nr:anti-sigma regulatory factor [Steroidobacteraceae bacterium]
MAVTVSSQALIQIDDRSQVGEGRRAAAHLTRALGFDATAAGNVALAVTEAATNIVKHARRGKLVLRCLERGGIGGLEILALDQGPGITNMGASLRDGHSTSGSMGTGLGALSRISHSMDIYTQPAKGTAVRLEFWAAPLLKPARTPQIGAVCLPKTGEVACGDAWAVARDGVDWSLLVVDGLGHGTDAARAARTATEVLGKHPAVAPGELLRLMHLAMASTRGGAAAVARFGTLQAQGVFAGVGNIGARTESLASRRQLVSHNGTLGHSLRKVQEFSFDFAPDAALILHSDGLAGHWALADYPGLMAKHPGLIAGVLYRDHDRGRDDVTVVVIKRGMGT